MKRAIVMVFVVALLLAGRAWAGDKLEGKTFVGALGKAGATTGDQDKLVFKNGTFLSSACVQFGFHEAPYTVEEKDGVVTFTSSPKNASGETMTWKGTIKDGVLEGTAVNQTASGETTYWFKGKAGPAAAKEKQHAKKSEHPEHPK